jgi:squalene cyclase
MSASTRPTTAVLGSIAASPRTDTTLLKALRPRANAALKRAVRFLVAARDSDGLWRDFLTFAGESDEWVSAYVCTALAGLDIGNVQEILEQAWRAMSRRRRPTGGWGYNDQSPADADSTAWGLRMASVLGKSKSACALRARKLLHRQQRHDGGAATCSRVEWKSHFERMSFWSEWAGWCDSHVCVTAVALDALDGAARRDALRFVRRRQDPSGRWNGYWWADHEYSTSLALCALTRWGQNRDRPIRERALTWISHRVNTHGAIISGATGRCSPFATACALGIFNQRSAGKDRAEIAVKCLQWLIRNQRHDGAWRASATLRLPLPDDRNPDLYKRWKLGVEFGNICLDHRAVFTTATVVTALRSCL